MEDPNPKPETLNPKPRIEPQPQELNTRRTTPDVVPGCGLRVGLGFRVWGLGFRVWGLGFRVWGLGFGVWVWGLGFRVWGLGFRV